jgi:hypothetical protein
MKTKRKRSAGRPNEGREKMTVYVEPQTRKAIVGTVEPTDRNRNTNGKVLDKWRQQISK